jgi:two-component system sensor kinase FixL
VTDSGPGLTGENPERIFETFYTTKPHGMGVGLSISRSIIEAHGGQLWAASNPDGGLEVRFTLPEQGAGAS